MVSGRFSSLWCSSYSNLFSNFLFLKSVQMWAIKSWFDTSVETRYMLGCWYLILCILALVEDDLPLWERCQHASGDHYMSLVDCGAPSHQRRLHPPAESEAPAPRWSERRLWSEENKQGDAVVNLSFVPRQQQQNTNQERKWNPPRFLPSPVPALCNELLLWPLARSRGLQLTVQPAGWKPAQTKPSSLLPSRKEPGRTENVWLTLKQSLKRGEGTAWAMLAFLTKTLF